MARPLGSKTKDKPWRDALDKAVKEREGKGKPHQLERIANACVKQALKGDLAAIKEIGDRLDGRAVQGVTVAAEVRVSAIETTIIDPAVDVAIEAADEPGLAHDSYITLIPEKSNT